MYPYNKNNCLLCIIDLFTALRQRGRFAGFSLFVSNTTDKENGYLCYKNGPELPTLNFKIDCAVHGRYVIFYNERLDGITYPVGYVTNTVVTEICEVIVTGILKFKLINCLCNKLLKFNYDGSDWT